MAGFCAYQKLLLVKIYDKKVVSILLYVLILINFAPNIYLLYVGIATLNGREIGCLPKSINH